MQSTQEILKLFIFWTPLMSLGQSIVSYELDLSLISYIDVAWQWDKWQISLSSISKRQMLQVK
jgi:hypothetical protein